MTNAAHRKSRHKGHSHARSHAPETSIHLPEEGVALTGDNVFQKCKSFILEAGPWESLGTPKRIEALEDATIVPGHGEPCDKSYLKRQSEREVLEQKIDAAKLVPYPIG